MQSAAAPILLQAQIAFVAPCSLMPSAYVLPSVWETKVSHENEITSKIKFKK
jgi:hypothetical protein